MRVIAGIFRSRLLTTPRGLDTRPTSDRLRESLFNVLAPQIADAVFVDLYAGSGSVGIEAASRGAAQVYFAENDRAALTALRANLQALGLRAQVESGGVPALLRRLHASGQQVDLVFLDPPYDAADEYESTLTWLGGAGATLLAPDAIVVAEHRSKSSLAESYGVLQNYRLLRQGDASLSFYRPHVENKEAEHLVLSRGIKGAKKHPERNVS